jgi:esterase/lipase superfamily enzyme
MSPLPVAAGDVALVLPLIERLKLPCRVIRCGDRGVIVLIGRVGLLTAAAIASALFCCGCASRLAQDTLVPVARADTEGTSLVPLLVATKRSRSATGSGEMFDSNPAGEMSYASITVSIPPDVARRTGEVQWPTVTPGDPRQSFVTVSANYLEKKSFVSDLSAAARGNARGKVLVFIHGFNNRFDEAVFRFAQIAHDSRAAAFPVLFSWPSRGVAGLRAYQEDVESANDSRDAIAQLLDTIGGNPNVKEVTVLCHSMGCFPTLEALHSKALRAGRIGSKVKNVMFVAPDVDINLFRTQMREMGSARPRFALFVSRDDLALKLSSSIWGGATRLGQVDPDQEPYRADFRREGVIVFDLTSLRGRPHSRAFREVTSVMAMIQQRFAEGQSMTGAHSEAEVASQ